MLDGGKCFHPHFPFVIEYCGEAPNAPLYSREVPGSNPDQVWVFFRSFPTPPHRGMSHITDKANAPIHTVPIPNLTVNVADKAQPLQSLSRPHPFGGRRTSR
jgi:hypothetical protein